MRWWKKGFKLFLVTGFACFLLPAASTFGGFKIAEIKPRVDKKALVLNGHIDISLNSKVEEALSKGIPLEFVIDLELFKVRTYFWNQKTAAWSLRRQIQYHALSGQYIVEELDPKSDKVKSFASLQSALNQVGSLESVKIEVTEDEVEPGRPYEIDARLYLNIESLPAPLRPVAYTSPSWRLSSEWSTWKVDR